nr:hypothetical protein [Tanacetum cinerariifolium]
MLLGKFLLRRQGSSRSLLLPNLKLSQLLPKNLLRRVNVLRGLPKRPLLPPTTGVVIRDTPGKLVSKNKAPVKTYRGKGIELHSNAELLEDVQLKETLRKSKQETHKLQASGSSEGADLESEVLDEPTCKTKDTSEGTGVKPGVPDTSKEDSSDSDDDSWGDSEDESDDFHDEDANDDDSGNDDGSNDAEDKKDKFDDEEMMYEEEDDDVTKELYGDLNITQGLKDTDMTNAEQDIQRNLYNALFESYNTDEDILSTYGDVVTLKRGRDDQDKDEDPSLDQTEGQKEEKKLEFEAADTEMQQDQGNKSGHIDDQLINKADPKHDWFQKPNKPLTPDRAWNKSKSVDYRPP